MNFEKHWQEYWKSNNTYKVDLNSDKPKYYVLSMFPYPSGSGLHVGHPEGYTAVDIIARYKKMKGYEVLNPMGFDSFGLPAEQYAIQTGNSPKEFTHKNISNFKKQLNSLGFAYDWDREVITSEPWYYKHTQWIFAQLFKKGYAEIKEIEVNWSPSLNTVLANEEVLEKDGLFVSERDGKIVEKKPMKQWVLKITEFADRLFEGLENLDWPNSIKSLQKNWIYTEDENGNKTLSLRDWVFARQRYWGEPFPIIHKKNGELYLIPESQYPITLPEINDYKFSQDGKPALSKASSWIQTPEGTRDLNTMPQWAGSCWYFIAYILKKVNENKITDLNSLEAKNLLDKWLPVDLYVGGQEHAVLHLLYARFWTMFLKDIKILSHEEPFKRLFCQGMILGKDGTKMSKSKGNVVNPDEIINEYGADALRIYEMFMGPLESDKAWSNNGIKASSEWLKRILILFNSSSFIEEDSFETKKMFNTLISKIEPMIEKLKFNTYITEMMIFINHLYKIKNFSKKVVEKFTKILSLVAPHYSEEIWHKVLLNKNSIYLQEWPSKFEIKEEENDIKIPIQINNKVRSEYLITKDSNLKKIKTTLTLKNINESKDLLDEWDSIIKNTNILKYLEGFEIKSIIFIPNKLLKIII